ncbi:N-acetylglutaminylglutamine synthetase, partial [Pseudomonas aeruginosa]
PVGILEDVPDAFHPPQREAPIQTARALEIPVVYLVCIGQAAKQPDYVIIDANEHARQFNRQQRPTAERFVALLSPLRREVHS